MAAKAAMANLLAEIFSPHDPIFQLNDNNAINDVYFVTFWLAVATIFLALAFMESRKWRGNRGDSRNDGDWSDSSRRRVS